MIIGQIHKFKFGEHNILTYSNYDTLCDLYAHHCKQRLDKDNEIVMLLLHYLSPNSVRFALQELEVDVNKHEQDQTLIIADAVNAIFNPSAKDFLRYLEGLQRHVNLKEKDGICVIADMGAFYHLRKTAELVEYETSIPSKSELKSSLLCIYHKRDLDRLSPHEQDAICKTHFRELVLTTEL